MALVMTKRIIRRRLFIGDSLSDRGTLDHLKLLDFVPMSFVAGLNGKSPHGRFTNGFLWVDMLGASESEQLEIDHWRHAAKLPNIGAGNADLADRLLTETELLEKNRKAFTLDDESNILYQGARYIRSYCEGGLTSADWKNKLTLPPSEEGARLVVSNLAAKRKKLLADDFRYKVPNIEKEETLVTEWSGANDLITVNSVPTKEAADKAVKARIVNLEALIRNGYKNFVLMNLPDLGLTPRYQAKSSSEQEKATKCSNYFNQQLTLRAEKLKKKYRAQNIFIDVFDVFSLLTQVYHAPEQYGFSKGKLKTPYTSSEQFKHNEADPVDQTIKISPADGYMFWDDVHPTATMHAWLAEKYLDQYGKDFVYKAPTTSNAYDRVKKTNNRMEDEYGLDVASQLEHQPHTHRFFPNLSSSVTIKKTINQISRHQQKLQNSYNSMAKEKAQALKTLLKEINKAWADKDLDAFNEVLNTGVDNSKFALHQNPRWDKFWQKETTHTEDILRDLQLAVNAALNLSIQELRAEQSGEEQTERSNMGLKW